MSNNPFSRPSQIGVSHALWFLNAVAGVRAYRVPQVQAAAMGMDEAARYFVDGQYLTVGELRQAAFDAHTLHYEGRVAS